MMFRRYAIYVTPTGPLAALGAAWLGWDIAQGAAVQQPRIAGLDVAQITRRPRKYGLHGTIKPPMVLAEGRVERELARAAAAVAEKLAPLRLDGLRVARIGGFLALVPRGDQTALSAMAAEVVRRLDPFRAPPNADDLARRRRARLTPEQDANLVRWGYPHVMEAFRFHITLTGPLSDPDAMLPHLTAHFAPVLSEPFEIADLTLAGEDPQGMFHQIARLPLGRG